MGVEYIKEGKIATFILNRPHLMNSLDISALKEFHEALVDFRDDPSLSAGIITGAGDKAFCTGIDIRSTLSVNEYQDRSQPLPASLMHGLEINKPIVAAINGVAIGGGMEIILACDIRIASESATFGSTEIKPGLIPAWGGSQKISRIRYWCLAAELLLTSKRINAQEAFQMGLINRVVPDKKLTSAAKEWARVFCNAGPMAIKAARESQIKGSTIPRDSRPIEDALEFYLKGTEDFYDSIKTFNGKSRTFYLAR